MAGFSRRFNQRRSAQALTYCRRCELAAGSRLGGGPSRALLRQLRRYDRDLEFYWHPHQKHWILYRVRRHADPASDEMFEELSLCGPRGEYREPGPWVLDWLRKHDLSQGGSIDLGYARRRALDRYDELDRRRDEEEHRRLEALHASAGGDLYDYAVREKRHFTIGR